MPFSVFSTVPPLNSQPVVPASAPAKRPPSEASAFAPSGPVSHVSDFVPDGNSIFPSSAKRITACHLLLGERLRLELRQRHEHQMKAVAADGGPVAKFVICKSRDTALDVTGQMCYNFAVLFH